jgi:hypothetical protein
VRLAKVLFLILLSLIGAQLLPAQADSNPRTNVTITYSGISASDAEAVRNVVSAGSQVLSDDFGFEMPARVAVYATLGDQDGLFTGKRRSWEIHLFVKNANDLSHPESARARQIFGLCHELGHIAASELTGPSQLSTLAAEGWATFAGAATVDRLFELHGRTLWPVPFDYRKQGTALLDQAEANPEMISARGWRELHAVVGWKGFPMLFRALAHAPNVSSSSPDARRATLLATFPGLEARLTIWWDLWAERTGISQ